MRPFCALLVAIASASIIVLSGESRAAPPPNWPTTLTIATVSPGGVFVIYGQSMVEILTEGARHLLFENLARGN
jgi:TRAP-type uncharacterized transport system substrate-binding protein